MSVVEDEPFVACGSDAGAQIAEGNDAGRSGDGKGAGKADVFVAFAVADGWERVDGGVGRKFFEGLAEKEVVDQSVCGEWQVVAVLLDGGGGQDEQGPVFGQGFHLLPVEVGEVARSGDPGVHGLS